MALVCLVQGYEFRDHCSAQLAPQPPPPQSLTPDVGLGAGSWGEEPPTCVPRNSSQLRELADPKETFILKENLLVSSFYLFILFFKLIFIGA